MTEQEIIAYIENIPRFGTKHTLAEVRDALHFLGDPDDKYPSIHVAGTNGKGSVCAFVSSILRHAGKKTGLFTSPHLVSMRERFRIDGQVISEEIFADSFAAVRAADEALFAKTQTHLSYFEFLYLMACVCFSEAAVDIAVIETGLGGRLDATNTLRHPLLSIITSVSYDHMEYLGEDLASIAGEKAGIIKAACPVVAIGKRKVVADVIAARAEAMGSPCYILPKEAISYVPAKGGGIDFSLAFRYDELSIEDSYHLPFIAPYQAENASLAILAMTLLSKRGDVAGITPALIKTGLQATVWEARMEEILPSVFLDGAHNADAVDQLVEAARTVRQKEGTDDANILLLFAASKDKAYREMAQTLTEGLSPSMVITTAYPGGRAVEADALAACFRAAGQEKVLSIRDAKDAFHYALSEKEDHILIICGSLYLAGMIKEMLYD